MKTLIIEDEIDAQNLLSGIISEFCPQLELVGISGTVNESVNLVNSLKPELLFLDIELEDGQSFEVLERIIDHNFCLIFTTAFSEYALKAIKVGAIDYLLKPYSALDVVSAVNKALKYSNSNSPEKWYQHFNQEIFPDKLLIPTSKGISFIKLEDIVHLKADRSYCAIHLSNKDQILVSKPLKEILRKLNDQKFIRIHTSHVINASQILNYMSEDGGYVIMTDRSQIPVSRKYKADFLELIKGF